MNELSVIQGFVTAKKIVMPTSRTLRMLELAVNALALIGIDENAKCRACNAVGGHDPDCLLLVTFKGLASIADEGKTSHNPNSGLAAKE